MSEQDVIYQKRVTDPATGLWLPWETVNEAAYIDARNSGNRAVCQVRKFVLEDDGKAVASELMKLVHDICDATHGCDFENAEKLGAEVEQRVAALEQKEKALDWLLSDSGNPLAIRRNPVSGCFEALIYSEDGDAIVIGSGDTPLKAVLDAMGKEEK